MSQSGILLSNSHSEASQNSIKIEDSILQKINNFFEKFVVVQTITALILSLFVFVFGSAFVGQFHLASRIILAIHFNSLLRLFNVRYSDRLESLFGDIDRVFRLEFIKSPITLNTSHLYNSLAAAPWKGKLSQVGLEPFLLQKINYKGIFLIVIDSPNFKTLIMFF